MRGDISNSEFVGNLAQFGGAVIFVEIETPVQFTSNQFSRNVAVESGGGIFVHELDDISGSPKFTIGKPDILFEFAMSLQTIAFKLDR